ncbi:MAG: dynamin family protein [Armatimonadetes bacterium]|nr:dynamin family protein [Armatimonadota bacterium]
MLVASETFDCLLRDVDRCGLEYRRPELRSLAEELRNERGDPRLRLLVLGEFGVGKSLLINSLLGEAALVTGPAPTTPLLCELRHGEACEVALVTPEGLEERGSLDLLSRADRARHTRACLYLPAAWLRDFVMVDTPGLGDLDEVASEMIAAEIPAADVILFVLHAQTGVRQTERRFLERQVLPQDRARLLFVLNQIDWIVHEEREPLLEYVRGRLATIAPRVSLFPYSAMEAVRARDPAMSGYNALAAFLRDEVLVDRRRLRQAGLLARVRQGLGATRVALDAEAAATKARAADLVRRQAEWDARRALFEARLEEVKTRAAEHLNLLAEEIGSGLDALRLRLEECLPELVGDADAETLRRTLPGYLDHVIRGFLDRQQAALRGRLLDVMATVDREVVVAVQAAGGAAGPAGPVAPEAVVLQPPLVQYDPLTRTSRHAAVSGMFALLIGQPAGTGFVALAASEVMRRMGMRHQEAADRARLIAGGQRAASECIARARDHLRETLDAFRQDLLNTVDRYGDERRRQLAEALERAPQDAAPHDAPGPAARAAVGALLERVAALEAALRLPSGTEVAAA